MKTFEHRFSWLRLIAAIFVAFIASLAWLGLYSEYFGFVGPYLGNVLLGFFGVLAGSFCFTVDIGFRFTYSFRRRSRVGFVFRGF